MTNSSKKITPLPNPLLPVKPFDYNLFPNGDLRTFTKDVAERMQCPPDFIAASIMVTLASAIGKSFQIEPKEQDDWKVIVNLWGVIIGSPSQLKSPAVSEVLGPIKNAETASLKEYKKSLSQHISDEQYYELKHNAALKEARTLIRNGQDANAKAILDADLKNTPRRPIQQRFLVHDTTVEKLGELLNENTNGLLSFRDEFNGFLKNIESIQKPNDRSFYLEAWNGNGTYSYDRIGRGSIPIENMTVSILGTIQPKVYASHIQNATKQGTGDDGFAQRFQLSVYPDPIKSWVKVDRKPDLISKDAYNDIVKNIINRVAPDNHIILKFSEDAQKVFNTWHYELETKKLKDKDDHSAILAHLAKYRSLMPSLALILHITEYSNIDPIPPVSEAAALLACDWCEYLESHARRIYSVVTNSPIVTADLILKKINISMLKNHFTLRDIQRKGWAGLSENEEIRKGLDMLVEHNFLAEYQKPKIAGRTSVGYEINPILLPKKPANNNKGSSKNKAKPSNKKKSKSKNMAKPKKTK